MKRFVTPDHLIPPPGTPLIEPAEAVAIALSMVPAKSTGRICSAESPAVRLVLKALINSGWKLVPNNTKENT